MWKQATTNNNIPCKQLPQRHTPSTLEPSNFDISNTTAPANTLDSASVQPQQSQQSETPIATEFELNQEAHPAQTLPLQSTADHQNPDQQAQTESQPPALIEHPQNSAIQHDNVKSTAKGKRGRSKGSKSKSPFVKDQIMRRSGRESKPVERFQAGPATRSRASSKEEQHTSSQRKTQILTYLALIAQFHCYVHSVAY